MFKTIRELFDSLLLFGKHKERVKSAVWEFEEFWATRLSPNVVGDILVRLDQHTLTMQIFPNEPNSLIYVFEEPFNNKMLIEFVDQLTDKGYKVTPIAYDMDATYDEICDFKVSVPPNYKRRFAN